jgi:hypothetical protein
MTIEEMGLWLAEADGGEESGALLTAFNLCLEDPESIAHLERFVAPVDPTDSTLFLLALGHYMAVQSIDVLSKRGRPANLPIPSPESVH